jgi:hypothetical protein
MQLVYRFLPMLKKWKHFEFHQVCQFHGIGSLLGGCQGLEKVLQLAEEVLNGHFLIESLGDEINFEILGNGFNEIDDWNQRLDESPERTGSIDQIPLSEEFYYGRELSLKCGQYALNLHQAGFADGMGILGRNFDTLGV